MGCGSSTALRKGPGPQGGVANSNYQGESPATPPLVKCAEGRQGVAQAVAAQAFEDGIGPMLQNRRSTGSAEFAQAIAALQRMPERTAEQVRQRIAVSDDSVDMAMAAFSVVRIQRAARRFLLRKATQSATPVLRPSPPESGAGSAGATHSVGDQPSRNALVDPQCESGQLSRAGTLKGIEVQVADAAYDADARAPSTEGGTTSEPAAGTGAGLEELLGAGRLWSGIRYFKDEAPGPRVGSRSPVQITDSMREWSGAGYYGADGA